MHLLTNIAGLRRHLEAERRAGRRIAFVPTMGNLHEGHAALARQARSEGDLVVASIFVNRLQFAPSEDFDRYPRTFEADCDTLRACGVEVVFTPTEAELYPEPQLFTVQPPPIGTVLEGEFRPGFFTGVATVVLKLFNIVQPDTAVFGKKDYQQLAVIRAMVSQLALPVRIVPGETVRAPDGLALSSRNGYLSAPERAKAPELYAALREVSDGLHRRSATASQLERLTAEKLEKNGWRVDYVAVRKQANLQSPADGEIVSGAQLVVLAAARLGNMRLIDNLEVNLQR